MNVVKFVVCNGSTHTNINMPQYNGMNSVKQIAPMQWPNKVPRLLKRDGKRR